MWKISVGHWISGRGWTTSARDCTHGLKDEIQKLSQIGIWIAFEFASDSGSTTKCLRSFGLRRIGSGDEFGKLTTYIGMCD